MQLSLLGVLDKRWGCNFRVVLSDASIPPWLQAAGWQPGLARCFPHGALVFTTVCHWCYCLYFTDKDPETTTG